MRFGGPYLGFQAKRERARIDFYRNGQIFNEHSTADEGASSSTELLCSDYAACTPQREQSPQGKLTLWIPKSIQRHYGQHTNINTMSSLPYYHFRIFYEKRNLRCTNLKKKNTTVAESRRCLKCNFGNVCLTSIPKLGCRVHCSFLHNGCLVSTIPATLTRYWDVNLFRGKKTKLKFDQRNKETKKQTQRRQTFEASRLPLVCCMRKFHRGQTISDVRYTQSRRLHACRRLRTLRFEDDVNRISLLCYLLTFESWKYIHKHLDRRNNFCSVSQTPNTITRSLVLSCSEGDDCGELPGAVSVGTITHNRTSLIRRIVRR